MNLTMQRYAAEAQFHDEQANLRARRRLKAGESLVFADEDYLDHESWIQPAIEQLLPPGTHWQGKSILDLGCGHGMASVVLARRGATVTGVDLSAGYVREARLRALANGVAAEFLVANAAELPFDDGCFDAVWGCAIAHHLDRYVFAEELARVLKPGGRAILCEPWDSPLAKFARRWIPYPGKDRTRDEQPYGPQDVSILAEFFPNVQVQTYQLLGALRRFISVRRGRANFVHQSLDWCDRQMLRLPGCRLQGRYAVIVCQK